MSSSSHDPKNAGGRAATAGIGAVNVGLPLTVLLMIVYGGFILLGTFAPRLLAVPVFTGGTTTWAFAYGLFVIVLGVALSGVYVLIANRRS